MTMAEQSPRLGRLVAVTATLVAAALAGPASARAAHGVTAPMSINAAGAIGDGYSNYPDMTPDGRFVAFASSASNLVPGDTNGVGDVFVRDRRTGAIERVSLGVRNAEGDGDSNVLGIATAVAISDDGRYVAFKSEASNLVRGDRNNVTDVFVRDRLTATTERVSVDNAGNEAPEGGDEPAISPDGRYVAFVTSGFDGDFTSDVYLRDRTAGTTTRISVDHEGGAPQTSSGSPSVAVTPGGPLVAFSSTANDIVAGDDDVSDVFVRDLTGPTPTTELVSVSTDGTRAMYADGPFGSGSMSPAITGDGRFVAFHSDAINFTSEFHTGRFSDVFVRDRQAMTTTLASPNVAGGEADAQSQAPTISPDGRFVAFSSYASDLVTVQDDDQAEFQLLDAFVHDRSSGSTELVSVASDHRNALNSTFDTHVSSGPVSADGLVSLLSTSADNLFAGDGDSNNNVFANDRRPGTDLGLSMTAAPEPVAPRAPLTYTLTARNAGPNTAPGAGIRDTLPADVTFTSASAGCVHDAGTVDCALGALVSGAARSVTITVTPKRTGTITNTAVLGSDAPDPDDSNNAAASTTTVTK